MSEFKTKKCSDCSGKGSHEIHCTRDPDPATVPCKQCKEYHEIHGLSKGRVIDFSKRLTAAQSKLFDKQREDFFDKWIQRLRNEGNYRTQKDDLKRSYFDWR